jgi:hypothetical protein
MSSSKKLLDEKRFKPFVPYYFLCGTDGKPPRLSEKALNWLKEHGYVTKKTFQVGDVVWVIQGLYNPKTKAITYWREQVTISKIKTQEQTPERADRKNEVAHCVEYLCEDADPRFFGGVILAVHHNGLPRDPQRHIDHLFHDQEELEEWAAENGITLSEPPLPL